METNNTTFANELSTRSKNGLSLLYGRDILKDPEFIAEIGMDGLKMPFFVLEPKALQELARGLHKFGYIDDVEQWLGDTHKG